jgi:hypothetical protein
MSSKEQDLSVLEIPVSKSWIRMVQWIRTSAPYCTATVKFINGEPTTLISVKKDIRFDKEPSIPQDFSE